MTHATDHPLVQGGRSAALATACVRGGVAAGLGLGVLAVLVVAAWISSPFPDGGPGGALHVAAGLWLLAHGVELVRTDTLSGVPAPLGVAPLLLTVLPVWFVHRAARDTLDTTRDRDRPRPSPSGAVASVAGGYLLVAAVVVVYSESGPLPAELITAGLRLPAVAVGAAGAGAWTALGRPLPGVRQAVALRAAGLGLLTLFCGGAAAAAVSLVWHAGRAQASFLGLAGEWSGRAALALLVLALLPNAAVWGAAYGLGPGFAVGTAALATPLGLTGDPAVPPFPLLAALPAEGRGVWFHWAVAAAPAAAAVVLGHRVGRAARAWTVRDAVLTVLGAAALYGTAVAVLATAAGGPLGSGRLSAFGPVWWRAGAAAVVWALCAGTPTALGVRAWVRRTPRAERGAARASSPVPVPAPDAPETGRQPSGAWSPLRTRNRAEARSRAGTWFRARSGRRGPDPEPGREPDRDTGRWTGTDSGSRPAAPGLRAVSGLRSFLGFGSLPRARTGAAPGAGPRVPGAGPGPEDEAYDDLYGDPFDGPGYEPYDYLPAAWEPSREPGPGPKATPEPAPDRAADPRPEPDATPTPTSKPKPDTAPAPKPTPDITPGPGPTA
ncbi:DUF6350 family protein [Streptomyces sp. NPDC001744]|uniref:cell division protein PerM n=1 Tax=Streptomyces sp. NPDC001744 TaxID=3364606 RepID=UPI0036854608